MSIDSSECLFCKIAAGDIPSHTVYETDEVLAFLDINPVTRGHTLVIPKQHATQLTDMDTETAGAVFSAVRDIADRIEHELAPDGINIVQNNGAAAGQEIAHSHIHIIPRYPGDNFRMAFDRMGELDDTDAKQLTVALRD